MEQGNAPKLAWRDGVPVADAFDDPYFSLENGLAETRYVFLDGNDLPARFRDGFSVAELGFGTGLNCLAVLAIWQASGAPGALRYTSFERFPMSPADMEQAVSQFPELVELARPLIEGLAQGQRVISTPRLRFELITGDARMTLPEWDGMADAWFLDGFAPAKNPEMWEPALMLEVARHTKLGGTFATYTAAGAVRTALADAGFEVERRQGFGRKRHMTVGRRR